MMTNPSMEKLSESYLRSQVGRVIKNLDRIRAKVSPGTGFVIPDASDIAIDDGRYLEATVMFLDICKFSQRPCDCAEDQAVMLRIISLFFNEMIRIVEDHGGVVEKNTGDGLMAYFARDPQSNVSIQQRALCCALTMFSAADRILNPIIRQSGLDPLDFRICMDHGNVTVARVGAARRFNGIVAIGTTANIASKMLSIAKENMILIGDAMLAGLPETWLSDWVRIETLNSGWTYRNTQSPYPFWQYVGRWTVPSI